MLGTDFFNFGYQFFSFEKIILRRLTSNNKLTAIFEINFK